ncbi:hypothetical protein DWX58_02265 [Pseudoflavonifractor sp. AF19-9AC]|uniref:histidine kinase dimerization/phospho-acceptor domain-containing protein n=1 Tax=Pseudoflavonifractor sp. AF19-9AC TaxID=2292244 RepID=UPI000E47B6EE|nr:histidine kinase dimerization/phospho-acceptor domain-containing protein [Pseudoflavonifractor sp. AF19-9AC]RHR11292.1 hypothetical protein DWX58_02265 [Pseudoflavonifractor sp. AF19-9AC]
MARIQSSPVGKLLSWALLLVFTFAGVQMGLSAASSAILAVGDWQSTAAFSVLLQERRDQLAQYFIDSIDWDFLLANDFSYTQDEMDLMQLQDDIQTAETELSAEATAFRYQLRTSDGTVFKSNLGEDERLSQVVDQVYYSILSPQTLSDLDGSFQWSTSSLEWGSLSLYDVWGGRGTLGTLTGSVPVYILAYGVPSVPPETISDEFTALYQNCSTASAQFLPLIIGASVCGILALIALGYALWTAGHKAGQEGITLFWPEHAFVEIHLLTTLIVLFFLLWGGLQATDTYLSLLNAYYSAVSTSTATETSLMTYVISLLSTLAVGTVSLLLRTIAVRCKGHSFVKTSVICLVIRWLVLTIRDFILSIPLTWRVIMAFLLYFFLNLVLFTQGQYNELFTGLWLCLNFLVLLALCWWTVNFRRLRKGSQALASGNLHHQIETQRMPRDLKLYAEDLNNISVGMASAVDEQMKSERFKAELITNVSHDLKTPLTSIINYVNLLKATRQDDPKALEYIEVLDRKSQRLKKLTEDLVEASKASTGVLSVNREKIGMAQLIDQALGEWTEKLEERKLTVVSNLPEGETWVYADGRHLWRVIDNLLSNCAKYAMEGTRVYLDLTRGKGQVSLSVKNISREALNIPPERLMERFVRGEESRTTEGSGLGLSIARSLTELQGGTFSLAVDGDLFKATVSLPQAN